MDMINIFIWTLHIAPFTCISVEHVAINKSTDYKRWILERRRNYLCEFWLSIDICRKAEQENFIRFAKKAHQ